MIVLGIDPGIHLVGYAFIKSEKDKISVLDFGVIKTSSKLTLPLRLEIIVKDLLKLCKKYKPTACGIEKVFFAKNVKTAINVAQARGAIIYGLSSYGLEINEYTPLQVKTAVTGYGRADKMQIQKMVKVILDLQSVPKPDDAADALAVALSYINTFRPESIEKVASTLLKIKFYTVPVYIFIYIFIVNNPYIPLSMLGLNF